MFSKCMKDNNMINHYLDVRNINKDNVTYSKYMLYKEKDIKTYLANLFNSAKPNDVIVITEAVVYEEDAFINSAVSVYDKEHIRYYTVNEVLDIAKKYGRLNYFLQFKEVMSMEHMEDNSKKSEFISLLKALPEHIQKAINITYENNEIINYEQNIGIYIFTKI